MHGPLSVRSCSVLSLVAGASRWEDPLITEHCSRFVRGSCSVVLWFFALHLLSCFFPLFPFCVLLLFTVRGPPRLIVCLPWPRLPPRPTPKSVPSVLCILNVRHIVFCLKYLELCMFSPSLRTGCLVGENPTPNPLAL